MDNKTLFYIAAALGTGYAACYVLKAAPAVKAFEITAKAFEAYIKEYPDTRHVFDGQTQKGTGGGMGVSDHVSAHDGARALGAWRAMSANQNLRKPTYKLYKKYGVEIHGNSSDGYSLTPADRAYALAYAGGRGVKIGANTSLNLAD